MSIRREGRGLPAALAARLAVVCAVVVALLGVTTQSASAACPNPAPSGGIQNWQTVWPTPGNGSWGVTLCHGFGSVFSKGYVHIVDLSRGAKLRLVSSIGDPPDPYFGHQQYFKRTAESWYNTIRAGGSVSSPPPNALFSTINASFFNDSSVDGWTGLSFPHRHNGVHETWGAAFYDQWASGRSFSCRDGSGTGITPDVCATKRALRIGSPTTGFQQSIGLYWNSLNGFDWPGYMDAAQARGVLENSGSAIDGTVAFSPTYEVGATGAANRRNYLGYYGGKVYIFTSDADYTTAEANAIMQEIQPGMTSIQLDGGGSAQFHSAYASMDSSIPGLDREVPDVLAIYRGAESSSGRG